MRRLAPAAALLAPLVLLAGCGSDPMSAEDVLGAAGNLQTPRAGLYLTHTKLLKFEMPGLPPAEADRFRTQMAGMSAQPQQSCVTQEQAQDGFEDMLKTIGEGVNGLTCGFQRFETDPPKLDALMVCEGAAAMSAEIAFNGTADATSMDLNMTMDASSPVIPGQTMQMKFAVSAEHIGDCASGS